MQVHGAYLETGQQLEIVSRGSPTPRTCFSRATLAWWLNQLVGLTGFSIANLVYNNNVTC